MNTAIPKELIEAFDQIVKNGDEAKAREFIVSHLKEFPQETQDAIITALIQEAVTQKNEEDAAVSAFQKEVLETGKKIDELDQELEKRAKLAEIKEKI